MLAGMVENPTAVQPVHRPRHGPQPAQRGAGPDGPAAATSPRQRPRRPSSSRSGLHPSTIPLQTGCLSASAAPEAFFCDFVLAMLRVTTVYSKVWNQLNTTGGLKIYTTLNVQDQRAATHAVNYVEPGWGGRTTPATTPTPRC